MELLTNKHTAGLPYLIRLLLILAIGIVGYGNMLFAQTAKTDIQKIGDYMNKATTYSADLEYVYYSTYDDQTFDEKILGKYARKNNTSYLKIGATENITTDHYYFSIDHDEKMIDISERMKVGDMSKPVGVINFDTLISLRNEVKYLSKNAETSICEIISDFMEYEKVQIYYNKNTFEIQKIVLYFPLQQEEKYVKHAEGLEMVHTESTAPRVEILYKNSKRNEELPSELFSYDKYVILKGTNNYLCKPEYKNYTIN